MRVTEIEALGVEVTWGLLLICFDSPRVLRGGEYQPRFVSASDVVDFATDRLFNTDDPKVVALAMCQVTDEPAIYEALEHLRSAEASDQTVELRKFRAIYVWFMLPGPQAQLPAGMEQIADIWVRLGTPRGTPGDALLSGEFWHRDYREVLVENQRWVAGELETVRGC